MPLRRRRLLALTGTLALAGCADRSHDGNATSRTARAPPPDGDVAYTHVRPSGNRSLDGTGTLPGDPLDVALDASPAWLVAAATEEGSLWVAVSEGGRARGFEYVDGEVRERSVTPSRLPTGTPPALVVGPDDPALLEPPDGASTLTHPVVLDDGSSLFVAEDGDLVRRGAAGEDRLPLDALPDARIVRHGDAVAVLAGATERYDHGVLGDGIEAASVAVADAGDAGDGLRLRTRIDVPPPAVVEGVAPILADLTGDGTPDLVVTESDAEGGARVAAYSLDGTRLAAGEPIGRGFRWRHQLAVAAFPPDGTPELAVVRTPHIGGVAEFYRVRDGRLDATATAESFGTHVIGSRNVDGALAGDFDGDGAVELLLPTGDRGTLAALRRTNGGVETPWSLSVGGTVRTNLAGVRGGDGRLHVGVGRDDGLRLWPG